MDTNIILSHFKLKVKWMPLKIWEFHSIQMSSDKQNFVRWEGNLMFVWFFEYKISRLIDKYGGSFCQLLSGDDIMEFKIGNCVIFYLWSYSSMQWTVGKGVSERMKNIQITFVFLMLFSSWERKRKYQLLDMYVISWGHTIVKDVLQMGEIFVLF